MFERRFTNKAEKAISLSQTAANELGHNYIGSEHILLGLIKEGTGIAAQVLKNNNINEQNAKEDGKREGKGYGSGNAFFPKEMDTKKPQRGV